MRFRPKLYIQMKKSTKIYHLIRYFPLKKGEKLLMTEANCRAILLSRAFQFNFYKNSSWKISCCLVRQASGKPRGFIICNSCEESEHALKRSVYMHFENPTSFKKESYTVYRLFCLSPTEDSIQQIQTINYHVQALRKENRMRLSEVG